MPRAESLETFLPRLNRSKLLSREQMADFCDDSHARSTPRELACAATIAGALASDAVAGRARAIARRQVPAAQPDWPRRRPIYFDFTPPIPN